MEGITKIKKVGGSLMATIPKGLARAEGLQPEQTVRIEIKKVKRSFRGILKGTGLTPWTKEDKRWMEGRHG